MSNPTQTNEAVLEYATPEYRIVKQGQFVHCAVTQVKILLEDLRYWSVEHQEAYASPEAVMQRMSQSS